MWPRQLQCCRSALCRHRINYQSFHSWIRSRAAARPDASELRAGSVRYSCGRVYGLSPPRKRVSPDYASAIRLQSCNVRLGAAPLVRPMPPRCDNAEQRCVALQPVLWIELMQPAQTRAGRRLRARQIEAAGRFSRLRGSTASSNQGCGAGEQHKRRPFQSCRCCHRDTARVVDVRTSPRLPCIRARQSRLPVSMRERSRGRPGHPAYCPPSNDDRSARTRVTRNCAINPLGNPEGFGCRVARMARQMRFDGYMIYDISLDRGKYVAGLYFNISLAQKWRPLRKPALRKVRWSE